jgi:hypothetical protein
MPSRLVSLGNRRGVFSAPKPAGMNGPLLSEALRSGLEKIDRHIGATRLHFPTASASLRHWRDGGGRDLILPASLFRNARFLLDHVRDSHRPKFVSGTKRRLVSGEMAPGQSGVEVTHTDSIEAPYFTDLFFALGQFTVRSRVQTTVDRSSGQLVVRSNQWRIDINDEYDWDPSRWALMPGIGRVTFDELLALHKAGHGRRYLVRSESVTITDPEVTAPATLPAGNY